MIATPGTDAAVKHLKMIIVAIDPGPKQSARMVWIDGKPSLAGIEDNSTVREWVLAMTKFQPNAVLAIEMIACYGMAVGAETFETCLFIGRLQEIWQSQGLSVILVYRRDVKMHLCGTMKAKDANIRQALIDKYGIVGTKKNPGPLFGISSHLGSALAIAVTAEDKILNQK